MITFLKLFLSLGVTLLVGFVGSVVTMPAINSWYAEIQKPAFTPPNSIFGPVWTFLYVLMGLAVFLVWKRGWSSLMVKVGVYLFTLQLVLNFLWSYIFFGMKNLGLATLEIGLLWVSIVLCIISFYRVYKPAGLMMIPYLMWVSFAGLLTFSVWQLNN